MKIQTSTPPKGFHKQYNVAFDMTPLPENPDERIQLVIDQVTPVINQMITDAMTVAIDTWPTPEKPQKQDVVRR